MKIEIWTDIICPWCGLATHQLDQALARFEHADQVVVEHRSFELNPKALDGVSEPTTQMLQNKLEIPLEQALEMNRRVERLAHQAGIAEYHVADNRVGATTLAHELLAWATEQGKHDEAWHLMFAEYFGKRTPIWTVDDLVAVTEVLGLDPVPARQVLTSRRYTDRVRADHREAAALGAQGVPFLVVDRRYGMSGAQGADRILALLDQAWADSPAAVTA